MTKTATLITDMVTIPMDSVARSVLVVCSFVKFSRTIIILLQTCVYLCVYESLVHTAMRESNEYEIVVVIVVFFHASFFAHTEVLK